MIHRLLAVGLLFVLSSAPLPAQEVRVLHITITVPDADGRDRPVPRHALLVSDNPPTGAPRRVVTSLEGTVDVRLRPGNYTIESDDPLIYQGRSYSWMQILDVPAGRDSTLALTAANAQVAESSSAATMAAGQSSPSELLMTWQGNVVNLWSDTARGAGFVLDRRGLILTNAHVAGASESVEVQFSATRKIAGRVLVADRAKHVAVILVDPSLVSSLPPAKLGYKEGAPALAEQQEIFSIDASLPDQKTLASGRVERINGAVFETDLHIDDRATGVPILTATGAIIGITSGEDRDQGDAVRIDLAATVLAAAEEKMEKMAAGTAPKTTALPVEPKPPATDSWKDAAPKRIANLGPYQFSTADFDVTLITPLLNHVLHTRPDYTTGASTPGGKQDLSDIDPARRSLEDFGNWKDYVDAIPPVLIVRATPKLKEKFWTTVGRMAASTQGVALPPFKKMQDSFASMHLYCGQSEITPIHPFRIERRLDNDNGLFEGLYIFDSAAIGSQCKEPVKLVLFPEKSPAKGDERIIDPKMLDQIAKDFAVTGIK